jgi:predicted RNA methylase
VEDAFYDPFEFLYDIAYEILVGGAYDDLDVVNATVVDVGAGVGDTAILFVLRGARRVIALEPYPSLYRRALVNIRISGVEDRIILVNAALGSFDGEVCAEAMSMATTCLVLVVGAMLRLGCIPSDP